MSSSHLSAKVVGVRGARGDMTVVAREPISKDETVAAFGGRCVTTEDLSTLPADQQRRSLQIDEHLFLAADVDPEPSDWINHSCEPNCGLRSGVVLVAMRDIAAGEDITYDYAMSDGSDGDCFECCCGAPSCRGKVTGADWAMPELQLRYRGYFSPYLAARVGNLVALGSERRAFAL